jgi:small-conductance mechanosensitive channel
MPQIDQTSVVAQVGTVDDEISEAINEAINEAITFLPRLVGAFLILLVGWILGRVLGGFVTRLADKVELDRMVLETPLGNILGGTERAVSKAFGTLARWFIYALAILAAADVLSIAVLSEWINTAVSYLPAFLAGLLIIVLGFVVADFIGDAIKRTQAATRTQYTKWFAMGVKMFLYFVAIVVGLDTMGIDVDILFVFARALAWGLAVAIALGAGLAFGFGGQDYVKENINRWMHSGKSEMSSSDGARDRSTTSGGSSDSGSSTGNESGSR